MKKMFLIISVLICLGFVSESRAGITCTLEGTKLIIGGSGTFNGCSYGSQRTATEVTIGTGVTSIGDSAFRGAKSLESITIPDSVTSIGSDAFSGASSLKSITIPDSVTSISLRAFYNASSLESITIPEGVTSIGTFAFRGAKSLTSITIPDSVTSIGDFAFAYASSLESITIPEGVTSIGESAFDSSGLTSITIPDSVTSIGGNAFWGATGLTSITIPEGVTYIGWCAFENASSLESIIIPDNIKTADWDADVFDNLPESTNIVCQGDLNKCYENLARYFTNETCPQNLIDAGKGNLCSCSSYCISPTRISEATDPSQCTGNYVWSGTGCSRKNTNNGNTGGNDIGDVSGDFNPADCYNNGQVPYNNQCLSEYPFAKKRWTPAEANEWLHDGNDNFVVITFKK